MPWPWPVELQRLIPSCALCLRQSAIEVSRRHEERSRGHYISIRNTSHGGKPSKIHSSGNDGGSGDGGGDGDDDDGDGNNDSDGDEGGVGKARLRECVAARSEPDLLQRDARDLAVLWPDRPALIRLAHLLGHMYEASNRIMTFHEHNGSYAITTGRELHEAMKPELWY
jgi:hypothetical protein